MRLHSLLPFILVILSGCSTHIVQTNSDIKTIDSERLYDYKLVGENFEISFPKKLGCSGVFHVSIKNTGTEPLKIDPTQWYIQSGENRYNEVRANSDSVSGSPAWVAKLLDKQEIPADTRIHGVVTFVGCIEKPEGEMQLSAMGHMIEFKPDTDWDTIGRLAGIYILYFGGLSLLLL